jgi:hypothetical protein
MARLQPSDRDTQACLILMATYQHVNAMGDVYTKSTLTYAAQAVLIDIVVALHHKADRLDNDYCMAMAHYDQAQMDKATKAGRAVRQMAQAVYDMTDGVPF